MDTPLTALTTQKIREAKIAILDAREALVTANYDLAIAEAQALLNSGTITRSECRDILDGSGARYSHEIVKITEERLALA